MADDFITEADDRAIEANGYYEVQLRYWTRRFGVSADQLKDAVRKVGPMADDVARQLGKSA